MKKFTLLFAFAFITLGVFAQSLTLSYPGGVISDGGSVTFTTPADVPITPGQRLIFVHNIGATDASVICTKEIIDTLSGTTNAFCWGACFTPEVLFSPSPLFIAAGDSTDASGFSGDYNAHGHVGESHIRYIFTNTTNHESVSVVVTYLSTPVSVNNYSQNSNKLNITPNPASNQVNIDYAFNNSSNNTIVVKNLIGATVYSSDAIYSTGKFAINTSDFTDGIYFVTFMSNNVPQSTKKLIIKH